MKCFIITTGRLLFGQVGGFDLVQRLELTQLKPDVALVEHLPWSKGQTLDLFAVAPPPSPLAKAPPHQIDTLSWLARANPRCPSTLEWASRLMIKRSIDLLAERPTRAPVARPARHDTIRAHTSSVRLSTSLARSNSLLRPPLMSRRFGSQNPPHRGDRIAAQVN